MFPRSPFNRSFFTSFASRLFRQDPMARMMGAMIVAGTTLMHSAVADDPPPAPRNAVPYVRPTLYHLLPPALGNQQTERVPTVDDLVPVLGDTPQMSLMSGPVRTDAEQPDRNDWPYTEATHGRDRFQNVAPPQPIIGAFRPARVPSKYSNSGPLVHTHAGGGQPVDEERTTVRASLFQAIRNPFVAAPVRSQVTQVSQTANVPIPDPLPSGQVGANRNTMPPAYKMAMNGVLYESPPTSIIHEPINHQPIIHPEGCPCDACQSMITESYGPVFGSQPTAIVSHQQTTFRLDGLVWWSNGSSLPTLATTSPVGTAVGSAGILNSGGTTSVFDDHAFAQAAPGYRFQMDHDFEGYGGIDFEFLQLGTRSETLSASSDQYSILARPFTELLTGTQNASLIAYPGQRSGGIQIAMDSRFRTAAAHYYQLAMEESSRSEDDLLVAKFQIGPRIASLQESLNAQDRSFDLVNGSALQRTDSMRVQNLFVGGEIGMLLNRRFKYVDLSAGLSLAMGANRQKYSASGRSILTEPGGLTTSADSGWLNSSIGSGKISRNEFSVMPSAEFGIGFETRWGWRLSFGYDVMLWTNALRVTEQIDSRLDTTFGGSPGAAVRPFPSLKNDSFLAHGVSFGIERRW